MLRYIVFTIILFFITSCSNWRYKEVNYERCEHLEKIHVHLYHHDSCEWYCLNFEEGEYTYEDSFKIKYKIDKKGKVKKVKLIK
jgi:hypothetical protein